MKNNVTLLLLAIAVYLVFYKPLPAQTPLAGEDVFELEYASNPRISPDGNWVLYNHVVANKDADQFDKHLVCYDCDTGVSKVILKKHELTSAPTWSPDSSEFAVAAKRGKQDLILLVKPGRATTFKSISINVSAKNLAYRPDGEVVIFNGFVAREQRRLVAEPDESKSGKWAPAVIEIERDIYRRDGQGYLPHGNHQLFLLHTGSHFTETLTDSTFDHKGPFSWRNHHEVLFSGQLYDDWEHTPRNSRIYSFDIKAKQSEVVIDIDGPVSFPQSLFNGNEIYFIGYKDLKHSYQQSDLFIYSSVSKDIRNVTKHFDRDITGISTLQSGQTYIRYDDRGIGKIGLYDPPSDNLREGLANNVGGVSIGRPYQGGGFTVSNEGVLVFPQAALDRPSEIAIATVTDTKIITDVTSEFVQNHNIGKVKRFEFKSSFDDRPIDGWVVLPPNFSRETGKTYPLVLEIHGGPFANYGSRFAMEPQLYAAAGYVVIYTNPRGSTSYGEEFAQLIDKDYPQQGDFEDLMSAVDYALENYAVDENRLYVTGGSGGGILTAWLVTKTDRFRAALSQKPVINWETLAYTSDGYLYFSQYWFDGAPTVVPDEYRRRSPLSYADKVKTPTMLMTGEQDWRTPITEAEQFYHALKINKVDTMLIRVPESSHAIAARPSRIWMKLNYLTAWFERYK
jgi:acylaminoacyl-peptidase